MKCNIFILIAVSVAARTAPIFAANLSGPNGEESVLLADAQLPPPEAVPSTEPTSPPRGKNSSGVQKNLSDPEITAKAKADLLANPDTAHLKIQVTTNNGVVMVVGNVMSELQKIKVMEIVSGTAGVKRVEDHLTVSNSN